MPQVYAIGRTEVHVAARQGIVDAIRRRIAGHARRLDRFVRNITWRRHDGWKLHVRREQFESLLAFCYREMRPQ
jgi:hypothetical protein